MRRPRNAVTVVPTMLPSLGSKTVAGRSASVRSSVVGMEQPLRKRVVGGSNPSAGTTPKRPTGDSLREVRSPSGASGALLILTHWRPHELGSVKRRQSDRGKARPHASFRKRDDKCTARLCGGRRTGGKRSAPTAPPAQRTQDATSAGRSRAAAWFPRDIALPSPSSAKETP